LAMPGLGYANAFIDLAIALLSKYQAISPDINFHLIEREVPV